LSRRKEKLRKAKVREATKGKEAARVESEEVSTLKAKVEELSIALEQEKAAHKITGHILSEERSTHIKMVSEAQKQQKRTESTLLLFQEKLNEANLRYRAVTETEIPAHKKKLDEMYRLHREAHKRELELKKQIENAQKIRKSAEQKITQARSTISFQLGYALLHANSVKAVIKLPAELSRIKKEAKNRRKQQMVREQRYSSAPAIIASTVATAPKQDVQNVDADSPTLTRDVPLLKITQPINTLRMACVMDEFTYGSYAPECDLQQLTPDAWESEITAFKPELLFIESAWRGKDDKWGNKVGHNSHELQGIIAWCKERSIPTLFWNKEDPVHFETFLTTAKQFDYVFTTDIDCIHRYKGALEHDRVFFLPFACQPANNNPIEKYERKDAFCFAGAYYTRYPERTKDLESFVSELPAYKPFDIYDRNFGKTDANYQFPEMYQPYIVGTLAFEEIDKAYKGYRYAINLNSIKQSQTMFARRVYELLASNTVTVSNFSKGVRLMFGDLVATADSGAEIVNRLKIAEEQDPGMERLRLAALRKVLSEHTYADRFAYLASKLSNTTIKIGSSLITVLAVADSPEALKKIIASYSSQTYSTKQLKVLVKGKWDVDRESGLESASYFTEKQYQHLTLANIFGDSKFTTLMVSDDYYGPNYLQDMALTRRYTQSKLVGKSSFFEYANSLEQNNVGGVYRPVDALLLRSAMVASELIGNIDVKRFVSDYQQFEVRSGDGLGIDAFNYCRNGNGGRGVSERVDDLSNVNVGMGLSEIYLVAEQIKPAKALEDSSPNLDVTELNQMIVPRANIGVSLSLDEFDLLVKSSLPDGKHEYIYSNKDFRPSDLGYSDELKFHFEITPGLNLQWVVLFMDENKQRVGTVIKAANCNITEDIPPETKWIKFGLRVYSSGIASIKGLVFGHIHQSPPRVIEKSDILLLTNDYPSYDNLYRNGFVHSRVSAYAEKGISMDVFRLRNDETLSFSEFQDVGVITGSQELLRKALNDGHYKKVLVHFLDQDMWNVLRDFIDEIEVIVWVHGAEVQPWHRRIYNYTSEEQLNTAKKQSAVRMTFWRGLLEVVPENLKLIFVSKYFAEEVMEDLGFRVPETNYDVIHNPIDTDKFKYIEKSVEQRKKILSIRPYASRKYANDLSVKAVLELSKKPFFNELEFRFVGDGVLFDEILEPLRKFKNVIIDRRFLSQPEIAKLHRDYGIFLSPTRMDAQGVSRDEAMASGLIPVSNAVTAIPEFVDSKCGILAPDEGYKEMADGIASLYENPDRFSQMSKAASERVIKQTASRKIIDKEVELFN
jgi:glycosyltransferase involved in cell wall biosynthesis/spore maturation protein CgeB